MYTCIHICMHQPNLSPCHLGTYCVSVSLWLSVHTHAPLEDFIQYKYHDPYTTSNAHESQFNLHRQIPTIKRSQLHYILYWRKVSNKKSTWPCYCIVLNRKYVLLFTLLSTLKCFVRSRIGYNFVLLLLQLFCELSFGLGRPITRNNLSSVTHTISILGNCYIPDYIGMKSSTEIVPALW